MSRVVKQSPLCLAAALVAVLDGVLCMHIVEFIGYSQHARSGSGRMWVETKIGLISRATLALPSNWVASHVRTTISPRSNVVGGILFCAFPAIALFVLRVEDRSLPMPWPILFAIFFLLGVRTIIWRLFQWDADAAASWIIDAVATAGFAVLAFWAAWHVRNGWSINIPFIPNGWDQNLARTLFACVGLVASLFAVRILRKAVNQCRNKPDDAIRHV